MSSDASNLAIRAEGLGKAYALGEQSTLMSMGRSAPRRLHWALDDISFDIHHGEAVGIIGHNGAGKSTLLKLLARITEPTRGQATIYGRVASLLEVGTGFHPELTGRENIFMNGSILGMRRAEIARHFDEIVDFAGVEKFIDTPVKRYSSGMQMRLAFSVAAHLQPEILASDWSSDVCSSDLHTLLLELHVANGQHLVDDQDLGLQMRRDRSEERRVGKECVP